jgi:type II secretory pathway pseudopilin PulG
MTLIELIVSMAIFLGLMSMVFALLYQNQRASEKSIGQADASAAVLLVFEKIRAEMRTGRVIANDSPGTLDYWIYERQDGLPIFGGVHGLVYLPGPNSDPDVAQLRLENGRLIREFQTKKSFLVPMGQQANISFQWNPGDHTLLVAGVVADPYDEPRTATLPREFRFLLSLNNVE